MNITFMPMKTKHLPLWKKWAVLPHVRDVWFIEGYEAEETIYQTIKGNSYDYPFIIYLDDQPIGYLQCSDLHAYRLKCPEPKGLFTHKGEGTWCMDLFIGEKEYLNKGYGTEVVRQFIDKLFTDFSAKKILIDPASHNKRAIRCYEKAGFQFERTAHDGVTECCVMKIEKPGIE